MLASPDMAGIAATIRDGAARNIVVMTGGTTGGTTAGMGMSPPPGP